MIGFDLNAIAVQITGGSALSAQINLGVETPVGIVMDPSAWTAAAITVQVSPDGTTWYELQDGAGNAISYTVSAGIAFGLNPETFRGVNMMKLRSGTSGAPVNQAATRNLQLLTRSVF